MFPDLCLAAEGLTLFPKLEPFVINLVTFLVLIYPIKRWLLEPLSNVLAERELKTSGAAEQSSQLQQQAAALAADIDARLRDARAASQRARAAVLAEAEAQERQILDEARGEAARKISALRESIQQEVASAREGLRAQGSMLAQAAASRILGRSL